MLGHREAFCVLTSMSGKPLTKLDQLQNKVLWNIELFAKGNQLVECESSANDKRTHVSLERRHPTSRRTLSFHVDRHRLWLKRGVVGTYDSSRSRVRDLSCAV